MPQTKEIKAEIMERLEIIEMELDIIRKLLKLLEAKDERR